MRTNSKQVKDAVKAYVLSCINTDGYDCKDDIKSQLELIASEFKSAACFPNNLKKLGTYQACFIDWLNGAPSCLSIEFYTKEILEIMEGFGLPLPSNKDEIDGVNLYHYLIFKSVSDLCHKNNVRLY